MKKKILMLGGSAQQIVVIEAAKELNLFTILCDYLPDNPGQYHADRFYQVSTTDREAILDVAVREHIDYVIAYASDPAAPTAAWIAQKLHLPGNPYRAVETLCNKEKFRAFLRASGLPAPDSVTFRTMEQAVEYSGKARQRFPQIIKPVDSSGSKGVTVVRSADRYEQAVRYAFSYSRSHTVIMEDYIENAYPYLVGGDIFVSDGKITLYGLMDCYRDSSANPLVPAGKGYPASLPPAVMQKAKDALQTMVTRLGYRFGSVNVELIADRQDRIWIIDAGPRCGGNMIPGLLDNIFHVDLVRTNLLAATEHAEACIPEREEKYWAACNLHTAKDGTFQGVHLSDAIVPFVREKYLYAKPGEKVKSFENASFAIGIIFLKFQSREQMQHYMPHINSYLWAEVQ